MGAHFFEVSIFEWADRGPFASVRNARRAVAAPEQDSGACDAATSGLNPGTIRAMKKGTACSAMPFD